MGNMPISCCRSKSPRLQPTPDHENCREARDGQYSSTTRHSLFHGNVISACKGGSKRNSYNADQPCNILQHISEREPDDSETDPSSNPLNKPIFATRSRSITRTKIGDTYACPNDYESRRQTYTPLTCSQDYGYNSATSTNLNQCEGSLIIDDSIITADTSTRRPKLLGENNQASILGDSKSLSDSNRLLQLSTTSGAPASSDESDRSSSGDTAKSMYASGSNFRANPSSRQFDRKKSSSCSTIYIDGSTISKPNLEQTMRYVSLAIYYHIKNRTSDDSMEIFDETIHPLSKRPTSGNQANNYLNTERESFNQMHCPDRKAIYKFVKTLIKAAQLTAEYAITTLVYLERLMTYGEMDLTPKAWRRMFLGAILLSSKVWEDQAVWNVDYAQILDEISVDDINELERQFLELIQFNMNVPSPVYAKYYFDLRTLASTGRRTSLLTVKKARALEAMSRIPSTDMPASPVHRKPEPERKRHSSLERLRESGRAAAILM